MSKTPGRMIDSALAGLLVSLLAIVGGCAGDSAVEATTVLADSQCRGLKAGLTRISYARVAKLRGSSLLQMTETSQTEEAAQPTPDDPADGEPLLVAISQGPQPTGGYRLGLEGAHRRNRTVVVSVTWQEPDPSSVQAQMITHPCLVVALPRADFNRVEAKDQSGNSVGNLDL